MKANEILIGNPLSGNGWKKFFALTLVWAATALVASAQTVTTLYSFKLSDGANPEFVTPAQSRDGDIYGTTFIGGSSARLRSRLRDSLQNHAARSSDFGQLWR